MGLGISPGVARLSSITGKERRWGEDLYWRGGGRHSHAVGCEIAGTHRHGGSYIIS